MAWGKLEIRAQYERETTHGAADSLLLPIPNQGIHLPPTPTPHTTPSPPPPTVPLSLRNETSHLQPDEQIRPEQEVKTSHWHTEYRVEHRDWDCWEGCCMCGKMLSYSFTSHVITTCSNNMMYLHCSTCLTWTLLHYSERTLCNIYMQCTVYWYWICCNVHNCCGRDSEMKWTHQFLFAASHKIFIH